MRFVLLLLQAPLVVSNSDRIMPKIDLSTFEEGRFNLVHSWQYWVHGIFLISSSILVIYSISRLRNMAVAFWTTQCFTDEPKNKHKGGYLPGQEPVVTVQICAYNEGTVVEETIRAACEADWPRDKLIVQVCDDSTDVESSKIIEEQVSYWRGKGVNAHRLSRPDRIGFKAGNMRYHFDSIQSDFVAYFDADHRMEPNFLKRTVPLFYDTHGISKDKLAFVQVPWCFYNTHANLLTECDALGLDVHHVFEQIPRATRKVFGFNGTGGIWRKQAITDAGGWTWDTVTEDLALSYNAFLRGYEMEYLRDVSQMLEVPSCILAHVQQKQRWTKGFNQVFRQKMGNILFSEKVPWSIKFEALCHLSCSFQNVCAFVSFACLPLLSEKHINEEYLQLLCLMPLVESCLGAIFTCFFKVPGSNGHYKYFVFRLFRAFLVVPLIGLRAGMCVFESKSVFEGLSSNDSTFLTTPKEGLATHNPRTLRHMGSRNTSARICIDDLCALLCLGLGAHVLSFILTSDYFTRENLSIARIIRFSLLCTCSVGMLWVNAWFLAKKHQLMVRSSMFKVNMIRKQLFCKVLFAILMIRSMQIYGSITRLKKVDMKDDKTCKSQKVKQEEPMTPVVVFANPRTGSSLLFYLLEALQKETPDEGIYISNLLELFDDEDKFANAFPLFQDILSGCLSPQHEEVKEFVSRWNEYEDRRNSTFKEYLQEKVQSEWVYLQQLYERFNQRIEDPMGLFRYLREATWAARRPLVAFKIFDQHLFAMHTTAPKFLIEMEKTSPGKYMVLWRRRMIEAYVSQLIAMQTNRWFSMNQTKDDLNEGQVTVTVNRKKLEEYITQIHNYYKSVRYILDKKGVDYQVFEYARDLLDPKKQIETTQRMADFLNLNVNVTQQLLTRYNLIKKQSQTPLSEQVDNWNEVVKWGYGADLDGWVDMFEDNANVKMVKK